MRRVNQSQPLRSESRVCSLVRQRGALIQAARVKCGPFNASARQSLLSIAYFLLLAVLLIAAIQHHSRAASRQSHRGQEAVTSLGGVHGKESAAPYPCAPSGPFGSPGLFPLR